MGRIRLHIALDCSAYSLETFIICNIEDGTTIVSDSWRSYQFIDKEQYRLEITNQSKATNRENLYGVHLVSILTNFIFPPYDLGFRFSAFKLLIGR